MENSGAAAIADRIKRGVKAQAGINAFASRAERAIHVMAWNHHDDDLPVAPAAIKTSVAGIPLSARRVLVRHFRIEGHWFPATADAGAVCPTRIRRPIAVAHAAGMAHARQWQFELDFALPRQGVPLVEISW